MIRANIVYSDGPLYLKKYPLLSGAKIYDLY